MITIEQVLEQLKDEGYELYTQSYGGIQLGDIKTKKSIAKGFADEQYMTVTIELALNKNYASLYFPYTGKYVLDSYDSTKQVFKKYSYSKLDEVVQDVLEAEKNYKELQAIAWKKRWGKFINKNTEVVNDV